MNARIQKWGNSQGLRLPKTVLETAHFMVGEEVVLQAEDGQIILKPAKKAKLSIHDLVRRMPKGAKAGEEGFGRPAGREEW
jgi:antitoxin MazE